MNILIIGGTRFLGRALVSSARERGHTLTLFNRGKSGPGLFLDVEQITGDRMTDLDQLAGRKWDVVIDTCGFEPSAVRLSAGKLADAVERYVFISSISAYGSISQPGVDESHPAAKLPEGEPETFKMENYGALKALCEQAAEEALPGRTLNIRPGLIVGEFDLTDRFTYWPWRVAQGGEVLAPDHPGYLTQFIDVRDLADWTIRIVEEKRVGIYNATGPETPMPLGHLLETSKHVSRSGPTGSGATFTWASEEFLLANNVQPWMEMPLWIPESDPDAALNQTSIRKALDAGLIFRPLEDTIRSTLAWAATRPADHTWRAGITREREAELLTKLKS
jgi:2'-hydroxyisoflavone reductase